MLSKQVLGTLGLKSLTRACRPSFLQTAPRALLSFTTVQSALTFMESSRRICWDQHSLFGKSSSTTKKETLLFMVQDQSSLEHSPLLFVMVSRQGYPCTCSRSQLNTEVPFVPQPEGLKVPDPGPLVVADEVFDLMETLFIFLLVHVVLDLRNPDRRHQDQAIHSLDDSNLLLFFMRTTRLFFWRFLLIVCL